MRNILYITQGRGKNCKIDCFKRNDLDYFFAYPEDYAQASVEWEENQFQKRAHHPAFEIIFIYSKNEGTLDIPAIGDNTLILELQKIFTKIVLNEALPDDPKDERVYELTILKSRNFEFIYGSESGISQVVIKRFRLSLFGRKDRITLETDPTVNPLAIYDLLEQLEKSISQYVINQVGIQVIFENTTSKKRKKIYTFNISHPNSCSLKHDEKSLIIKKMLIDSGLELKHSEPKIVHSNELEAVA
ncbi:MAG: hypothetical protein K2Q14_05675 [Gammaproteobacteria bacterium]|nr:hypothetical protein [Gammaproteobacteria bacterium]